ncbi:MAG: hypothetical protein V7K67_01095 [Nostoc sp.]|uniref:hypothetical protein n=1 Tax=Nostoc sp. TaxID=1180 RepID=UPI002FFC1892
MVHLKDFLLVSPDIQSSDVLKAIETAIPAFAIEQAIANTNELKHSTDCAEGRCVNGSSISDLW